MAPNGVSELPVVLIGAGDAGVDEMRPIVEDTAVQWALLRFDLGEGSFKRQKILFVHINGDGCPALARGRANQLTGDVKQTLRGEGGKDSFHASLEVKKSEELHAELLLERVAHCFVTDQDANYSVQWMLKEYERQLETANKNSFKASEDGGEQEEKGRRIPGCRAPLIFTSGRDALKAVAEPLGPWNWLMLQADPEALELVEGGEDSIEGMQRCIESHPDLVMFGLLRMGFGEGRLRRTKYVFVHANGTGVSAVARGRLGANRPQMEEALGQLATITTAVEINDVKDLTLEDVIDRVRRAAIIDDDVVAGDGATKSIFTVEAFRQALEEEKVVTASFQDDESFDAGSKIPGSNYTVAEAVSLMRVQDAPLNWALFGPNPVWIRERKSMQAPPNVAYGFVPTGGYMAAANRRSTSERPPARASVASDDDDDDEEETSPAYERKSVMQRVSVFGGGGQHRASSAHPLGSNKTSAPSTAEPPVPTASSRSVGRASSRERVSVAPRTSAAGQQRRTIGATGAIPTASLPGSVQATPARSGPSRARLAGALLKQSGSWLKGWQLRWFEVGNGSLRWWDSPEDAARGKECKGCQQLVGMKVSMVKGSNSQFTVETAMGKDKTYVFDASASSYVAKADWGLHAAVGSVTTTAADWIKALERESMERRKTQSFESDLGRELLKGALAAK